MLQAKITLLRQSMHIPDHYDMGDTVVVPMWAGQELKWRMSLVS